MDFRMRRICGWYLAIETPNIVTLIAELRAAEATTVRPRAADLMRILRRAAVSCERVGAGREHVAAVEI